MALNYSKIVEELVVVNFATAILVKELKELIDILDRNRYVVIENTTLKLFFGDGTTLVIVHGGPEYSNAFDSGCASLHTLLAEFHQNWIFLSTRHSRYNRLFKLQNLFKRN